MNRQPEPGSLGEAISELIRVRGLARKNSNRQLEQAWKEVAGVRIDSATHLVGLKRGVVEIAVENAALLNELVSFHRHRLLKQLQAYDERLKVRDLRFRLQRNSRKSR